MSTDSYVAKYQAKAATTPARPAPLLQVRVIGAAGYAQAVLADVATRVRPLLGPDIRFTTTTRPARRVGHVRVYLTVTRKETPDR
jgi:hypothetical protein